LPTIPERVDILLTTGRTRETLFIWEIGSGYFGCRSPDGTFAPKKFAEVAADPQIKMVEL